MELRKKYKMKIQLISDLHLEHQSQDKEYFYKTVDTSKDNSDTILVVAGDFHSTRWAIPLLEDIKKEKGYKDFIYTPGNHEFYGTDIGPFINNSSNLVTVKVIDGVKFICSPLYSNYVPHSDGVWINDFICTWKDNINSTWTPALHTEVHNICVFLIEEELKKPFDGKTVVVSHFLPSFKSVNPKYEGSPLNNYFANNLDDLILNYQPYLWLHGHTHDNCDYLIRDTRVVCNPAGYYNRYTNELENKNFNPYLIIEV